MYYFWINYLKDNRQKLGLSSDLFHQPRFLNELYLAVHELAETSLKQVHRFYQIIRGYVDAQYLTVIARIR